MGLAGDCCTMEHLDIFPLLYVIFEWTFSGSLGILWFANICANVLTTIIPHWAALCGALSKDRYLCTAQSFGAWHHVRLWLKRTEPHRDPLDVQCLSSGEFSATV
jgi:hypothetical protein